MQNIAQYLSDPGWWFSVFFIGIIVSIIGTYLYVHFGKWLEQTSAWYRTSRAKSITQRRQAIVRLVNDPTLLIIETVVATAIAMTWAMFLLAFLMLPVWYESLDRAPELRTWVMFPFDTSRETFIWQTAAHGLTLIAFFPRVLTRLLRVSEAVRVYRHIRKQKET